MAETFKRMSVRDIKAGKQKSPPVRRWDASHGEYIVGRAALDGVDALAVEMEGKWGNGRLRLLVDASLRERFDRQRYLLNMAITNGSLDDIRREAPRMIAGWKALDKAAEAAGATLQPAEVWEVTLDDGTVAAIVRDPSVKVEHDGRRMVSYGLDEIGLILSRYHEEINAIKRQWSGATVVQVRKTVPDPLDGIREATGLDDPLDDLWRHRHGA